MSLRRVAPPRVFTAPALAAAVGLVPPAATAELVFNQFALTGDSALGVTDGAEFEFVAGAPTLNAAGDVAFRALLRTGNGSGAGVVDSTNREAIFGPGTGSGTPLSVLARAGQTAPGVIDGAKFNNFTSPTLNAAGDVAFRSFLRAGDGPGAGTVDGTNDQAIFGPGFGAGTPLSVLAREDQTSPGVADGAEFDTFNLPRLNVAGDVAFFARLRTGDGPGAGTVTFANRDAIFGPDSGSGTALSILARQDQTAPGVADGAA